jgi:hypothetical protein
MDGRLDAAPQLPAARFAGSDLQSNGVLDGTLVRSRTRGLTTNLLNPKIGVFYMAMLPQLIPQNSPRVRGRDPISNRGIVPKPLSGQALSSSCP